jgi:hypothetical protein
VLSALDCVLQPHRADAHTAGSDDAGRHDEAQQGQAALPGRVVWRLCIVQELCNAGSLSDALCAGVLRGGLLHHPGIVMGVLAQASMHVP